MSTIYMDHAATTALNETALQEMLPYFREQYGNPSAVYDLGQTGKNALEKCRDRIAKAIGALRTEIYFTSGGTESDNWAIRSVCRMRRDKGRHIITSAIEHNAVLKTVQQLEEDGFEVTYLQPDCLGRISPEQLEAAIREDTILISIMLANNVVGTIQDIPALAAVARKHHVSFHTDAVQAVGHIPLSARKLGVDYLSASAHKFGGPKGVGFLYCRIPNRLKPYLTGGGQEKEGRSGTENVPGIVGMTRALEIAVSDMAQNTQKLDRLTALMHEGLHDIGGLIPTGDPQNRLPGFCTYLVEGISHSVMLINKLNEAGIAASSGSACSASSQEASHVLLALGYEKQQASCSLRLTLGPENTEDEVRRTVDVIRASIAELRSKMVTKAPRLEGRVSEVASEPNK